MIKNKISQKINLSSVQVIKTLQLLMQGNYSMKELIKKLNEQEQDVIFNNSVISKYINTCRYCGFDIPKINNKYYVAKIPFGLELSDIDLNLLEAIQTCVKEEMTGRCTKLINSFVQKISNFSDKKISRVEKSVFIMSMELFERALSQKRKINLIFKNQNILECIPMSITKENGKAYFNVFHKRIRHIDVDRLSGVEVSDKKYIDPFGGEFVTIFKLKGGLAKRYEARENEQVELNSDGTITVTNRNENKELLFSRLLRYDDKCEILKPKIYREEMKNLIDDMLKNYEV